MEVPLYEPSELPKPPTVFRGPTPEDEEVIRMSKVVLEELCRGRDIATLPAQIREYFTRETRDEDISQDLGEGGEEEGHAEIDGHGEEMEIHGEEEEATVNQSHTIVTTEDPDDSMTMTAMVIVNPGGEVESHAGQGNFSSGADISRATESRSQTTPLQQDDGLRSLRNDSPARNLLISSLSCTTDTHAGRLGNKTGNKTNSHAAGTTEHGDPKELALRQAKENQEKNKEQMGKNGSELRASGKLKGKQGASGPGPDPKPAAEVVKNPDGFYEVQVDYAHCMDIAGLTGVKFSEVLRTIQEDNQQRRILTRPVGENGLEVGGPSTGQ